MATSVTCNTAARVTIVCSSVIVVIRERASLVTNHPLNPDRVHPIGTGHAVDHSPPSTGQHERAG
jgi:hypothetical protein